VLPLGVFGPLRGPCGPLRGSGPRSRTPDAAGRRLPGPRRRSPTSATVTTRGHTLSSRRSSRASGGFRPHYTPAPWGAGCVGRSPRRRDGDLRAATRSPWLSPRRPTCVGEAGRGPVRRSEGERALLTMSRGPSSAAYRAPGSPARVPHRPGEPTRWVARIETSVGCPLAKGGTVEKVEVLSDATESLHERGIAPPCAPGPGSHHATSFAGGIAPGCPRLFAPPWTRARL
jgi:hypothetical protein